MSESAREIKITRWNSGEASATDDFIAVEEPLQVIVDGRPLAVLMRTPGEDENLVTGFLLTEGIIEKVSQIRRIDLEARDNHALVFLIEDHAVDWERLTRHLYSASSCGMCGKASIEAILQNHAPITTPLALSPEVLLAAPDRMCEAQKNFQSTGGIHASGIFSKEGELLLIHEDVGRHNALDKVIGHGLRKGVDFANSFLLVSGRISFELMQKAVAARIPLVAGISAPSSLAVDFAGDSGQTLVGFLRAPTFNIYAGEVAEL